MRFYIYILILIVFSYIPFSYSQWVLVGYLGGVAPTSIVMQDSILYVGTSGNGIFKSNDNGGTWSVSGLSGFSITALAVSDSFLFAGTNSIPGDIYISSNKGDTWNPAGLTDIYFGSFLINGNNIYAGTIFVSGGIYLSSNNGRNWIKVNRDSIYNINTLRIKNPNLLFAGTEVGVFLSTNDGENWSPVNNGLPEIGVSDLIINDSFIFAGTHGGGVFLSMDNGANWESANSGLSILNITVFAQINNELFAATENGIFDPGDVFLSTNNGASWSSTNLLVREVWSLAIKGNYIFAGGGIGGIYRRLISEITSVDNGTDLTDNWYLEQNFPNPFNPSTKIIWNAPISGWQTLKIYDVLGNEVATLVDEYRPAGSYEAEFDASYGTRNLVSGVYFYQLKVGNYFVTKKMLLIE